VNCEFYNRPNVFLSEVATSVSKNTDCLTFFPEKVQRKVNKYIPFAEFAKYNSQDEGYAPDAKELTRLLENVSTEEKGRALRKDLFLAGSQLMIMATNYLAIDFVLTIPQEVSKNLTSSAGQTVIDNPTTESVIQLIVQKTWSNAKRKIFAMFDLESSDEEIPAGQPSSSKKKKKKNKNE